MDGNIKDTPPTVLVPARRGPRRAGTRSTASWPTSEQKVDARKQAARAEFDNWLAAAKPDDVAAMSRPTACAPRPLSEGTGNASR